MIFRLRTLTILFLTTLFAFLGWRAHSYFFDTQQPSVSLAGITDNTYYRGDIACCIESTKPGTLSVWLDNQPLTHGYDGIKRNREYPFTIPTQSLPNGKHSLKIELTDSSFNKNKITQEHQFYVDNVPLQAALVQNDTDYRILQGRTLHVQFQVNKEIDLATVNALSNTYPCFAESKNSSIYEAFIPIACEENPNEYLFTIDVTDRVGNMITLENKFTVVMYPFKKQTLTVSQDKVQEEKEKGINQHEFEEALISLFAQSPQEKLWRGTFCVPIDQGRTTCEYGTIRTTQEKGRYMHKAIDLASLPKAVVWTPQNGKVILKDRYASSGNTIIVDHGCGILSLFFHLDNFADIEVGQKVAQGNPIGTVGKTGYATGYHLHWEMRINNVPVDPMQWTRQTF